MFLPLKGCDPEITEEQLKTYFKEVKELDWCVDHDYTDEYHPGED